MKIINVQQGSQEWLKLRAEKLTASEAPSMMGCGFISRDELMRQKTTGITPEVTPALQAIFNKGHAAEALARPFVEAEIGEDLYPATAISGKLLASFDGITMMEDIVFEHKLWNEKLAEAVKNNDLPPKYYWQLEQQLLVSGAEKAIFVVSDGAEDKKVQMEYRPVPGRADELLVGWKQFEEDLKNYQPKEQKVEATGAPVKDLPALTFQLDGLSVLSNISEYKASADQLVAESKLPMESDQDFADRESLIKSFKIAEGKLKQAADNILGEITDVDQFVKDVKYIHEQIRQARLNSEKLVKAEKGNRRNAILGAAKTEVFAHLSALEQELEISLLPFESGIDAAMKSKRTIASLESAANDAVAQAKIKLNSVADNARINLATISSEASDYRFLFNDLQQIVFKPADDFTSLVNARIIEHKAEEQRKLDSERERIRAEEQKKAESDLQRKVAEAAAKDKASAEAELPEVIVEQPSSSLHEIQQSQAIKVARPDAPAKQQMVKISEKEYLELLDRDRLLSALEAGGVDNWVGYGDALEAYREMEEAA